MNSDALALSNGVLLEPLCFGTDIVSSWGRLYAIAGALHVRKRTRAQISKDWSLASMVKIAMDNGCTMFDTSRAYGGSERVLGKVLRKYPRDSYTVVTKLDNQHQFQGDVRGAMEQSLHELGLDYVDLYLMHWPVPGHFLDSWKEMERLYDDGLCRAIGVCNCNVHHLEEINDIANVRPMVNEIECHPFLTQDELRGYCTDCGVRIMAYTSTARMDGRFVNGDVFDIAQAHGVSMAQVILRWHQQIGNIPIVNSTKRKHLLDNCRCGDFTLTDEEISKISNLNINSRLRYDPENCNFRRL